MPFFAFHRSCVARFLACAAASPSYPLMLRPNETGNRQK